MVINTNIQAQINSDNLQTTQTRLSKSLARLSSGTRIIQPSDDAAGLAVASRIDAQINRIQAAKYNVNNAVSFVQTQHGYVQKIGKALDRMGELSILAQDGTKTDSDRDLYNKEFSQLQSYILSAATKDFNGVSLFSPSNLEVAIDSDGTTFAMAGIDMSNVPYSTVANSGSVNVSTTGAAASALTEIKNVITQLSKDRANIGAFQTRLNYTSEQLTVSKENLSAASSRIQDTDVAEESTEFAKQNILSQSGTAMLAQANQLPQSVLRLLQ
jgi:flagellin